MALSSTELADINALLSTETEPASVVAGLRRCFPTMTVTQCDASDVDLETPFREWSRFSLFLVDRTDHCWRLTSDTTRATGLVVVVNKTGA